MSRIKKSNPGRIDKGLTSEEQHALYTFLTKEPYHKGIKWLLEKGISVSITTLQGWYSYYASRFAFSEYQLYTTALGEELKAAGTKVTDPNLKQAAAKLFERQAILKMSSDQFMRWYMEDRRLTLQEDAMKLEKAKFERLKRIEEESRKALTEGGTEAELIAKWKQILNFGEQS